MTDTISAFGVCSEVSSHGGNLEDSGGAHGVGGEGLEMAGQRPSPAEYRADLPTAALVRQIRELGHRQRAVDRLVCRYLADLADRIARRPGDAACGGYFDVFEASEALLGFGTRRTRERVRIGRALRQLPRIEQALESGEISFTHAREITRIARTDSETKWLALARTLPIRELERRVAQAGGRTVGKDIGNPPPRPPKTETLRIVLDLSVDDWILLQSALGAVRDGAPATLSDAEAIVALATAALQARAQSAAPEMSVDTETPRERNAARAPGFDLADSQTHEPTHGGEGTSFNVAEALAPPDKDDPAGAPRPGDAPFEDRHPPRPSRLDHDGSGNPDPAGSRPDSTRPDGTRPGRADPAGSRPDGTRPGRADPAGSRPDSTRPGRADPAGPSRPGDARSDGADSTLHDAATLLRRFESRPRWSVDDLWEVTGLGIGALSEALLMLELNGALRRDLSGSYYLANAA